VPITDAQKSPTFFHNASGDIDEVMVTLESSAKAMPVEINTVAAAAEIVATRMCGPPLSLFSRGRFTAAREP
jgi:hypothetical protein